MAADRVKSRADAWQALADAAEAGRLEAFPNEAENHRRLVEASNPAHFERVREVPDDWDADEPHPAEQPEAFFERMARRHAD